MQGKSYDAAAERAAIEGELLAKVRPSGPVATGASKLAARINGRPFLDEGSQIASVAKRLFALRRRGFA